MKTTSITVSLPSVCVIFIRILMANIDVKSRDPAIIFILVYFSGYELFCR